MISSVEEYFARDALLPEGWARDVLLSVEDGEIVAVKAGSSGGPAPLAGPVLPGMANLHSHAFQRAMAGLTELRGAAEDDFWTWRELMYRFVERLTPDQAQVIAHFLYIEMLRHGYTAVAEFHYVHHPDGMLQAHLDAARDAGIAMTLMPSVYRWAGFGERPLEERQQPFKRDADSVLKAFASLKRRETPELRIGVSPHSLRAVDPTALKHLVSSLPSDVPIHIHAAEQTREVEQCIATLGARPVQWLLENLSVGRRWCIVHATHLDENEMTGLAKTGAVAGLCPTTEANLGDGIFPLLAYRAAGGRYGIGGDSHVSRNPAEELRMLEYVQRLHQRKRNLVVSKVSSSVGTTLWLEAAAGGGQALGRRMGALAPGMRADLVVLDGEHPDLAGRGGDAAANALLFSGSTDIVRDVMVGGRWVVQQKHHAAEEAAASRYRDAVRLLLA
jgi:formimidoylglutamate deiminase